jgi:hypothetical protein
MLETLQWIMTPPLLVVLGGVVGTVAVFARLFRRAASTCTRSRGEQRPASALPIDERPSDPFDAFLASLREDTTGE